MFNTLRSAMAVVFSLAAVSLVAAPPPALKDPFLDNFVGDWSVWRKMGNGRTIESTLRDEWVLKHQFIQRHYGAGKKHRNTKRWCSSDLMRLRKAMCVIG